MQTTFSPEYNNIIPRYILALLELSIRSESEDFSSDVVTVSLEWTLLNLPVYYQQLLCNVSINAVPPLRSKIFARNMRAHLTLSYNTLYNVNVTQHSTCQQLIQTKFLLLNYSKFFNCTYIYTPN